MDAHQQYIENLFTARNGAAATLAQILTSPKPSYAVHGHRYSWDEYQTMLREQISGINQLLSEGLPFESISQGM